MVWRKCLIWSGCRARSGRRRALPPAGRRAPSIHQPCRQCRVVRRGVRGQPQLSANRQGSVYVMRKRGDHSHPALRLRSATSRAIASRAPFASRTSRCRSCSLSWAMPRSPSSRARRLRSSICSHHSPLTKGVLKVPLHGGGQMHRKRRSAWITRRSRRTQSGEPAARRAPLTIFKTEKFAFTTPIKPA
jgi:hypothetical protein